MISPTIVPPNIFPLCSNITIMKEIRYMYLKLRCLTLWSWQENTSRQVKSRSSGLNEVHEIRYCYPVGASDTKLEKSHLIKV